MKIVADLHIHSPYARAVSKEMTLENLDYWARLKGINVMGTGDFTHPAWIKEIKTKLEPAEEGLYKLNHKFQNPNSKQNPSSKFQIPGTRFLLTSEVSSIYSKGGKVRRIHNLIFAPSVETVEKINAILGQRGNIKSDGRPILGLDAKELAKIVFDIDNNAAIVPAHCLLPGTLIHMKKNFLTPIDQLQKGDEVYTHNGRWKKVTEVLRRKYNGKIFSIKPYYFRSGLATTPEHPFFAIKTKKNCHWSKGICKPAHEQDISCTKKHYRSYKPTWIPAGNLEIGDVLIFPRFKHIYENHTIVQTAGIVKDQIVSRDSSWVYGGGTRSIPFPAIIPVTKEFCRLAGYFLAEGCVNGRDAVSFTFHANEVNYTQDVGLLMKFVFAVNRPPVYRKRGDSVEIIFYSKIAQEFFAKLFYKDDSHSAATKAAPLWMLGLTLDLQVEIMRGWWRGDKGYTVSRTLMNQMKILFLRLGILPSIYEETAEQHKKRGNHEFDGRIISARHTLFSINRLSFFEDPFGLLDESEFRHFKSRSSVRHGWLDDNFVYLPIRDIEESTYNGAVYNLEVEDDNSYVSEFAAVHNCWTPWFSVFGSMSGFDSLEECFEELTPKIFAVETGLSSDPAMNWRWSKLDNIALISNSDSHSLTRIGREANVFDCELSYNGIMDAIKSHNPKKFLHTIEFYPEEGKYHYDGHRLCKYSASPEETKKNGKMCPVCKKAVTVGVMNRVAALANRPVGAKHDKAIPFKNLAPLDQIIAEAFGVGVSSKKVKAEYMALIERGGNEFKVLGESSAEELKSITLPEIVEGIMRVREGRLSIEPGYDGEYGKVKIFGENTASKNPQASLF